MREHFPNKLALESCPQMLCLIPALSDELTLAGLKEGMWALKTALQTTRQRAAFRQGVNRIPDEPTARGHPSFTHLPSHTPEPSAQTPSPLRAYAGGHRQGL